MVYEKTFSSGTKIVHASSRLPGFIAKREMWRGKYYTYIYHHKICMYKEAVYYTTTYNKTKFWPKKKYERNYVVQNSWDSDEYILWLTRTPYEQNAVNIILGIIEVIDKNIR